MLSDILFFAAVPAFWLLAAVAMGLHKGHLARARLAFWREAASDAGLSRIEESGSTRTGYSGKLLVRFTDLGEEEGSGTRVEIWGPGLAPGLTLGPEPARALIGSRSPREIEVGDDDFDREVSVQGPPAVALAVLDPRTRRVVRTLMSGRFEVPGHRPFWVSGRLDEGVLRVTVPERAPGLRRLRDSREPLQAGSVYLDGEYRLPGVLRATLALAARLVVPKDLAGRLASNLANEPEPGVRRRTLLTLLREFQEAEATRAAVEHLGYVQIDTINVIERCHHHILFTRIPEYRREHLRQAQTVDKTVFEYWTHALSYLPTRDMPFFVGAMRGRRLRPHSWYAAVKKEEMRKVLGRIRRNGALTIRDIDDDVLVEKDHEWASRKPSKRALQLAFYRGMVTISQRTGMLKTYELMNRHFGWERLPKAASETEILNYLLDRALRAQGVVSVDSICYLDAPRKPAMRRLIETRMRRKELAPVELEGAGKLAHWVRPETLDAALEPAAELVHILSPFDPLVHQRKRLQLFFDYEHRFEAYVPKEKRLLGYFALPALVGDDIVAAIDLKTDRAKRKLLVQKWTWVGGRSARSHKRRIEEELHRFERFQLES
jgi:hypothetical protein